MVVAAYGLILPAWVLQLPRLGCLNIHASVLPRWRGAAPIHRAIEAGDTETGVTIMQMDEGLDTGDMLLVEKLAIGAEETTASLHDRLATLGGRLIVEALELAACGGLTRTPQPAEGVTYAHKIDKAEGAIDWSLPAALTRAARAPSTPSLASVPRWPVRPSRSGRRGWTATLPWPAACRGRSSGRAPMASGSPPETGCWCWPSCSAPVASACRRPTSCAALP
jgi:hypothetical protein